MAKTSTSYRIRTPAGGWSNDYSDNPEDWGYGFQDLNAAQDWWKTKAMASQANSGNRKSNSINTPPQSAASAGIQQGAAPSGFSNTGSYWDNKDKESATTTTAAAVPTYDTQKVESYAQRVAAPGVKKLRDQVQQVQGGVYENPNVKAMTLRQALGGYGSGLGDVMGGAFNTATGMYNQEYQPQVRAAEQANQYQQQLALQRNQQSWAEWMKKNYSN